MHRFAQLSLRDVLWLTLIVGLSIAWHLDRSRIAHDRSRLAHDLDEARKEIKATDFDESSLFSWFTWRRMRGGDSADDDRVVVSFDALQALRVRRDQARYARRMPYSRWLPQSDWITE